MPYCAECGARYAPGAASCPMCGTSTAAPGDDERASEGEGQWADDGDGNPVERLLAVRRELIRLSATLRRLTDDDYASQSQAAVDVRDGLAAGLDELDVLELGAEFAEAQEQLALAARQLLQSFDVMMQLSWPGATLDDASRAEAQREAHEATQALRAAGELLAAVVGDEAVSEDRAAEDTAELAATSDQAAMMEMADEPEAEPAPALLDDWRTPEPPGDLPPLERPAPPRREPPREAVRHTASNDPFGEALEWEVLNRWAQHRVDFYQQIDEVVQGALTDALGAALEMRTRAQRDTEAHLERLNGQRRALLDEIEALRHERERLRDDTAQLRIELERVEHARTNAESEAQQMLRDARIQRARLLGEIEALTKQLSELHRAVTSLPGLEHGEYGTTQWRAAAEPERPVRDVPPTRAAQGEEGVVGRRVPSRPEPPPAAEPVDRAIEEEAEAAPVDLFGPAAPAEPEPLTARAAPRPVESPVAEPPPPPRPAAGPAVRPMAGAPAESPAAAPRPAVQPRPSAPPTPPKAPEPVAAASDVDSALADLLRDLEPAGEPVGDAEPAEPEDGGGEDLAAALTEAARPAAASAVPASAPAGPAMTEIRIVGPNVIRQRPQFWMAVKALQGVRSVLPRVEEGALVLKAQHERGPDLIEDLVNLPGMNLKLVSASFPDRVELSI